jgi:hypothetical protein
METAIAAWVGEFERTRSLIAAAVGQLTDDQFRTRLTPETNSCAIIVKHLAGNMKSRWTDWLRTDGEKPWRNRDDEFEDRGEPRAELMAALEAGWGLVFGALRALGEKDLARTITIRAEPHTVAGAVERQIAHYAYHAGQIQLIARVLHGNEGWQWATVPPGGSRAFNASMQSRFGGR